MAAQLHDSSRPVCFLLRLPPSVRRRIYLHLGVTRWDGLPMLFDLDGPVKRTWQVSFRGLLLSCRLIYGEASGLLFSSNRFVIHYRHVRGNGYDVEPSLQSLRNLTTTSLASLANLKIVLNQTSCHQRNEKEASGKCCDDIRHNGTRGTDYCRQHHTSHHDRPLRSSHSEAGPMLDEWFRTANYLSSRISPGTLRFSLVCDLDHEEASMDTAARVVAPLSLFPELRDCDIRLCKDPNFELARVARNAALQACRQPEPLPRELRLRILEYTDLITPWKEVLWRRGSRGYRPPAEDCYPKDSIACRSSSSWHHGCQFQGCYHQKRVRIEIADGSMSYHGLIGCFCRPRHTAFSSAHACRCWAAANALVPHLHALVEDARFVFFSCNRFVVSDSLTYYPHSTPSVCPSFHLPAPSDLSGWTLDYMNRLRNAPPPDAYAADGFAASHFLREIVPANCLGHLRFLELIFPPYNHLCWPHDGHPVLQDWIATVEWMKTALNTPGLALWMTMAGTVSRSPNRPEHRTELSQAQGDAVLAGYDRILQPLACLGGELGQFYADFAWPWKWTRWSLDMLQALSLESGPAWIKAKENVLDERAERSVLGNRYDRLCAHQGRFEMRPWREEHRIYDW